MTPTEISLGAAWIPEDATSTMLAELCEACNLVRAAPAFRSFRGGHTLALLLAMYGQAHSQISPRDPAQQFIVAMMALQLNRVVPFFLEVGRPLLSPLSLSLSKTSCFAMHVLWLSGLVESSWTAHSCAEAVVCFTRRLSSARVWVALRWRPWLQ